MTRSRKMPSSAHPYSDLPPKAFWRRAVASVPQAEVDPVGEFNLTIDRSTKVATAGSCFAQHIARHLAASGYNYQIEEPGHPILPEPFRRAQGYGLYSCRYGNIYTARQLVQLFERAYGRFEPQEDVWQDESGTVLDPFRPNVQPGGFISEQEMRRDRAQHLTAVRRMFETLDLFVFTLGLTECWRAKGDGAVYPVCPGVLGGRFDPDRYQFYNQPAEDVVRDLEAFVSGLLGVNPSARIVLTVSPVPLVATAQPNEHVLSATTYSKSVLRVAAETVRRNYDAVEYFPSFEIVTGQFNRGSYFADDLRGVLEAGVEHVMRLFMRHATHSAGPQSTPYAGGEAGADYLKLSTELIDVECEEAALDP